MTKPIKVEGWQNAPDEPIYPTREEALERAQMGAVRDLLNQEKILEGINTTVIAILLIKHIDELRAILEPSQ